jgi:hypothetical protein
MSVKRMAGRKKGQTATKDKYLIQYYNKSSDVWDDLGIYPSLRSASQELKLSYGLLTDLNIGRRKLYNAFYKIIDVNAKVEETPEVAEVAATGSALAVPPRETSFLVGATVAIETPIEPPIEITAE